MDYKELSESLRKIYGNLGWEPEILDGELVMVDYSRPQIHEEDEYERTENL